MMQSNQTRLLGFLAVVALIVVVVAVWVLPAGTADGPVGSVPPAGDTIADRDSPDPKIRSGRADRDDTPTGVRDVLREEDAASRQDPPTGVSLRVLCIDDEGGLVAGKLILSGLKDTKFSRDVDTDGSALVPGLPFTVIDIQFAPRDRAFEHSNLTFTPPDDFAGKSITVSLTTRRKIRTTVHFWDTSGGVDQDERQIVRVRKLLDDKPGEDNKVITIRMRNGQQLRGDNFRTSCTYELAWVRDGSAGPTVTLSRTELARTDRITLQAPMPGGYIRVYVKNDEGEPLPNVRMTVAYQGGGYETKALLTNTEGVLMIPHWDKELATLVVRPPEGVPARPMSLMNPEDGATMVLDMSGRAERVRLVIAPEDMRLLSKERAVLEVWTHPDASLKDWQKAAFANHHRARVTISANEAPVPDRLRRVSFERPEDVFVVLRVGHARIAEWPLTEFLRFSDSNPLRVPVTVSDLSHKAHVRMSRGAAEAHWIIAQGRAPVAELVNVINRKNESDSWADDFGFTRIKKGGSAELIVPEGYEVFTGIDESGRFAVFSTVHVDGEIHLAIDKEYPGASIRVEAGSSELANAFAISRFFQVQVGETTQTSYWNETGLMLARDSLPRVIRLPRNTPILILPVTETYALTREYATLAEAVYRPQSGAALTVTLVP